MKISARLLALIIATVFCVAEGRAQGNPKPADKAAPSAASQSGDPAFASQDPAGGGQKISPPRIAPEMESLEKALAGKWTVKMKFEPSEKMPKGAEGIGEEVWRAGPGGFTFMEEADDRMPSGEVFLTGFMWWDGATKKFQGMLCTSQNPRGCDPQGSLNDVHLTWDGKQFVVDIESERNGKRTVWHEVFFEITPTSFMQTGEVGEAGGPLKRVVTIQATKVGDGSGGASK